MLTKTDIAAIRKADDLCVHLGKQHGQGLVRLIKRKRYDSKPFETDQEYILENVTVGMETGLGAKALEAGTAQCFAMAGIYHDQSTPVASALKTLREGDELKFSFYPDCRSNGYVAAAGLHADCLYLHVRRNGKRVATWVVASSICPDNSARMCIGVPTDSFYDRAAEERRAIA
jgi:hypothetical protein